MNSSVPARFGSVDESVEEVGAFGLLAIACVVALAEQEGDELGVRWRLRLGFARWRRRPSDCFDREAGAGGVGRDDGVVAADGAFDDGDVDDVVMSNASRKRADRLGLLICAGFGGAKREEAGE